MLQILQFITTNTFNILFNNFFEDILLHIIILFIILIINSQSNSSILPNSLGGNISYFVS